MVHGLGSKVRNLAFLINLDTIPPTLHYIIDDIFILEEHVVVQRSIAVVDKLGLILVHTWGEHRYLGSDLSFIYPVPDSVIFWVLIFSR